MIVCKTQILGLLNKQTAIVFKTAILIAFCFIC